MKKFTFPMLLATALVAASCSSDELNFTPTNVEPFDDSNMSRIELGGAGNNSRTGFTEAATTLKLHYVSTWQEVSGYNDGAGKSTTLYMTSSATAAVDGNGGVADVSAVSQTTGDAGQMRYWDDIHGKNSKLALYAIAVPNKSSITKNASVFNAWDANIKEGTGTPVDNTIAWQVSTTQTAATIADEDLAYSNNVTGSQSLVYNTSSHVFEQATGSKALEFKHALSRFTINVKKGNGFGDFASEFNVTSVKLSGFTTSATLNVTDGSFTTPTTSDVEAKGTSKNYIVDEDKKGYTYNAQVFPNTTIKDVETTMLTIVVDGNNYYIKGGEIYNALVANGANSGIVSELASLKQGKNYELNITINKTSIMISSAKLVDWDTVSGTEMTPSNAIALSAEMEKSAGTQTTLASDLYRSTSLTNGYTVSGNKTTLSAANEMGDIWYWPNNTTKYYLRTISPQGTAVSSGDPNTITMTGGAIADGNDYIWGAPLAEKHDATPHTFVYNNGYTTYLHDPIGPTSTQIHLTQFHMMSKIQVTLKTTDGTLGDEVDLSDATVELQNYFNTATLALSNAKITLPTEGKIPTQALSTTDHLVHTWRVIPQPTAGIVLKITASGNVYKVALPSTTGITEWVPGKAYEYTFVLKKTAIEIASAKLVDWVTVTAADKEVTLESKGIRFWK